MVPYATVLIPLYVMLHGVGLQNSLVGLSLVLAVFQLPFATYMMRISFEAVPRELDECALIDGCGAFSVLWRILLPSVRPGLITVSLFAFLAAWNDFFAPLILLNDPKQQTLSARHRRPPPTDDGSDRLRRDGSRRRRDGAAVPDPVSVSCSAISFAGSCPAPSRDDCDPHEHSRTSASLRARAEPTDDGVRGRREQRTIHDVARRAKVSVGTVSKALNNKGRLRQETRERIVAAGKRPRLSPNNLAQSLHRARSMTVGILSNDSFGRFTFPIVEALERRLFDHGIAVFMCNATDDAAARAQTYRSIARQAGRRARRHRAARRQARADRAGRARPAGGLCVLPGREPGMRFASCPTTRAAPSLPSAISPRSAADGSPISPARNGSRRFVCAKEAIAHALARGWTAVPAGECRPGRWSEAWGREAVQDLFTRRRDSAGRALLRQRPDRPRGNRRAARDGVRRRRRTSPSSASTIGR